MGNYQINFCPCTAGITYQKCCAPYHQLEINPTIPELLMRSRYAAYAFCLIDYLIATTHPSVRHLHHKDSIETWAKQNNWLKLEICHAQNNVVEFKAYYQNKNKVYIHHERSTFKLEDGKWYYLEGEFFD